MLNTQFFATQKSRNALDGNLFTKSSLTVCAFHSLEENHTSFTFCSLTSTFCFDVASSSKTRNLIIQVYLLLVHNFSTKCFSIVLSSIRFNTLGCIKLSSIFPIFVLYVTFLHQMSNLLLNSLLHLRWCSPSVMMTWLKPISIPVLTKSSFTLPFLANSRLTSLSKW